MNTVLVTHIVSDDGLDLSHLSVPDLVDIGRTACMQARRELAAAAKEAAKEAARQAQAAAKASAVAAVKAAAAKNAEAAKAAAAAVALVRAKKEEAAAVRRPVTCRVCGATGHSMRNQDCPRYGEAPTKTRARAPGNKRAPCKYKRSAASQHREIEQQKKRRAAKRKRGRPAHEESCRID